MGRSKSRIDEMKYRFAFTSKFKKNIENFPQKIWKTLIKSFNVF